MCRVLSWIYLRSSLRRRPNNKTAPKMIKATAITSNQKLGELLAGAPLDCSVAGEICTGSTFAPPSGVGAATTVAADDGDDDDDGVAVDIASAGSVAVAVA